ncbi:MAG TPA: SpoIIE family protein phosphatase [Ramlibacter sp.]|nr:SpoIIE family protein phosphatase [Ramlibacter sp.]
MIPSEPEQRLPIRALVVDDDPIIQRLLVAFLGARGYSVEQSSDGLEALERVRQGGFNLVVTDRNMPRMDGLALCRAVRAMPSETYLYCIMLTSMREEASLVAAMEAGVDDFLAKPLRLGELGARLHAAERMLSLEAGLASRNRALADANDQMRRDLELARVLQTGQLPAPGSFGNLRFDWMFEASGYVGGDVFDYFALDERHLCFYLADVSGHGVPAAMMAFHTQHQLRAASQQAAPLQQGLAAAAVAVVAEHNQRFLQMKETSLYLTLLFGLVDLQRGEAALVQAGHPPPLYRAAPAADWQTIGEGGLPIGMLAEPGYEAHVVALPPGARLVLYSDGIPDCRDADGAEYGLPRLRRLLQEEGRRPLAAAGERLHGELRGWCGDRAFDDDVTLLALEAR